MALEEVGRGFCGRGEAVNSRESDRDDGGIGAGSTARRHTNKCSNSVRTVDLARAHELAVSANSDFIDFAHFVLTSAATSNLLSHVVVG